MQKEMETMDKEVQKLKAIKDSDALHYVDMRGLKKNVKNETVINDYVDMTGVKGCQGTTKMDTIDIGYVEMIGKSHERDQKILESESCCTNSASLKEHYEECTMIEEISFPKSIVIDYKNFSMDAMLGEGRFGTVFMGYLDIGVAR